MGNISFLLHSKMQSEIADVNAAIDSVDCPRAGFAIVHARIKAIRATGREIPGELVRLERTMQAECISQSRGD